MNYPLPVHEALKLLGPSSKGHSITLGRVYARLYPIRERTVAQLASEFRCSQTLIRSRLDELQRLGLVEHVLKLGKCVRPTRHYTRTLKGLKNAK